MSPEIETEIEQLLQRNLNDAELLQELGAADGALFASPQDQRRRGLRAFRNAVEKIRDRICASEFALAHGQNVSTQRKALAVAATLDFLGAKGAATASVLVIQVGLDSICSGRWEARLAGSD